MLLQLWGMHFRQEMNFILNLEIFLKTGLGLYKGENIEFRGAAFTVGGDANIDGLVTFANILSIFNPKLEGISHGMGNVDSLPSNQFNVAESGAETDGMPEQAKKLIERLKEYYTKEQLKEKWIMLFITVGTEEFCAKCDPPNIEALRHSIQTLRRSLPKLFVVLVGPIHVARSSELTLNLLKPRCPCLSRITDSQLANLQQIWRKALTQLEAEFYEKNNKYPTFSLLALSKLKIGIDNRQPLEQLFLSEFPLLNRQGNCF
uniref:Lipase_GDSL domain-containing protein n=1 Tax=Meloidogyne incognita TaxID=6306 RepID=A0A914MQB4_MELIC